MQIFMKINWNWALYFKFDVFRLISKMLVGNVVLTVLN